MIRGSQLPREKEVTVLVLFFDSSTQWKREDPTPSSTSASSTAGSSTTTEEDTSAGASPSGTKAQMQGSTEEKKDAEAEGLAQLIPDIQETAKLLQQVVQKFRKQKAVHTKSTEGTGKEPESEAASLSPEERYLASMKPLQFGKCCHVSEFLVGVGK